MFVTNQIGYFYSSTYITFSNFIVCTHPNINQYLFISSVEEPVCQAHDNTATNHYSLSSVEQDFCSKSVNEAGDFCQEKPKKIKKFSPTNSIEKMIKIRLLNRNLNKLTLQTIEYACYLDHLTISSKIALKNVSKRARMSQKSFRTATKLYNNSNSPSIGIYSNIFESRGSRVCPFDVPSNCDYRLDRIKNRVVSQTRKMIEGDGMSNQIYSRVSNWITSNDFMSQDNAKSETGSLISNSKITDITSGKGYILVILFLFVTLTSMIQTRGIILSRQNLVEFTQ